MRHNYWLWPGRNLEDFRNVERIYMFQGHFDRYRDQLRSLHRGRIPLDIVGFDGEMILTYRLDNLVSVGSLLRHYYLQKQSWENYGIRVIGLQIDYDSPSRRLISYALWLGEIRKRLDETEELSITGLADWLVSASSKDLNLISEVADYTAYMMYQGSSPLIKPDRYINLLVNSKHPFKLGLLSRQTGETRYHRLKKVQSYQGQIIFLLPGETD